MAEDTANGHPDEFEICVGGCFGPTFTVRLNKEILTYERSSGMYSLANIEEIMPDDMAWAKFWSELDAIGIWEWSSLYENPVEEGTHWFVHIVKGERSVTAEGENAYPGAEGLASRTNFERFLAALRELLGGVEFW